MVEVCALLCYCLLCLDAYMHRDNTCMYMAHVSFYVCCSDYVGVCGKVCCVAAVIKHSVLALEC